MVHWEPEEEEVEGSEWVSGSSDQLLSSKRDHREKKKKKKKERNHSD